MGSDGVVVMAPWTAIDNLRAIKIEQRYILLWVAKIAAILHLEDRAIRFYFAGSRVAMKG
jgi:hypothetical protein